MTDTLFSVLGRRISLFLNLPMQKLDTLALKHELDQIGLAAKSGA